VRRIKDLNIVIVEDDTEVNELLKDYFSQKNRVQTFFSAEEALKTQGSFSDVDVFIIDYKLPGLDGVNLFQQLRAVLKSAKYILITGEMNYEVAENTRQLGPDALILKPFDFNILEDNIATLISAAA
jgi:DNA-binding response OmpR family regulator